MPEHKIFDELKKLLRMHNTELFDGDERWAEVHIRFRSGSRDANRFMDLLRDLKFGE